MWELMSVFAPGLNLSGGGGRLGVKSTSVGLKGLSPGACSYLSLPGSSSRRMSLTPGVPLLHAVSFHRKVANWSACAEKALLIHVEIKTAGAQIMCVNSIAPRAESQGFFFF